MSDETSPASAELHKPPMPEFKTPAPHPPGQVDPWSLAVRGRERLGSPRSPIEPGVSVTRMAEKRYRLVAVVDFPTRKAALAAAQAIDGDIVTPAG